jgi:hypothetical protein
VLHLQVNAALQDAIEPVEGRGDEVLLAAVPAGQRVAALYRPVDIVGDPGPVPPLGSWPFASC